VANILLVEDDDGLIKQIELWLTYESHEVQTATNGRSARQALTSGNFDVIVLDWVLPDASGVDLCQEFRKHGGHTPILMLSGKQSTGEKVCALDAGADDYLAKPFHPKELSARLSALLRRPFALKPEVIRCGCLELNTKLRKIYSNGEELSMPQREFSLLELFMEHPGYVFTAEELVDQLWSAESDVSPSIVKVYVNKLRNRLADLRASVELSTARGAGYSLKEQG